MIARDEEFKDITEVWGKLAAPLAPSDISWRIDSKPKARDGRFYARFVCYIDAGTVRNRLDSVVPGEWDLTLEPLRECTDSDGVAQQAFKAKLQVLGVVREDVGQGPDYKQASTDAFKRAAVRFGIGHELYAMEQNWVEVDSDSKFAKPVEDPQAAYDKRYGSGKQNQDPTTGSAPSPSRPTDQHASVQKNSSERSSASTPTSFDPDAPSCPKCGGRMWDNRVTKRNPKSPDHKCRDRNCDGVVWPKRDGTQQTDVLAQQDQDGSGPSPDYGDDIPF